MQQPRFRGYVGERSVAIVLEQTVRGRLIRRKSLETRSVHQENIEPAIVVVVVERHTTPGRLQQIFVLVLPAENSRRFQSRFLRDIHETNAQGYLCRLWWRIPDSRERGEEGKQAFQRQNHRGPAD